MVDVAGAIFAEESRFFELLSKAKSEVPKIVAKLGMSGDTLAVLHHTHGYDPETVASVVNVPPHMLADYHAAMEAEKSRSRAAQNKTVVTIKGLAT